MLKINVKNFSCIKEAELEIGRFTLIIGPQASGKSVLCKLVYFFIDLFQQQTRLITEGASFDNFKQSIKDEFHVWFPVSAWGNDPFVIEFKCGECEIKFLRTSYRGNASDNFRIFVSEALKDHHSALLAIADSIKKRNTPDKNGFDISTMWATREASEKSLEKIMGTDFVGNQLFVPAGRSFFTSVGKAVSAFEYGRTLDPLILNFGRMFAQLRDRNLRIFSGSNTNSESLVTSLNDIFGGEIKFDGKNEFVIAKDGRRIPLSALSSGQQELLPLITVLPRLLPRRREGTRMLVYIEEPEAHLFPQSQSKLVEALSSMVSYSGSLMRMIITTHSPYVLSKFNNLIKAGQLARSTKGKGKEELEKIIPATSRISERNIKAYAIVDGCLQSIIDTSGLIAADYLDSVSCEISDEFSALLNFEYSS